MTKEEKQLLLKDICERLPYGVIVQYKQKTFDPDGEYTIDVKIEIDGMLHHRLKLLDFKPCLRPMSSMTEEEALELWDLIYSSYRRNKILEIIIKGECIDYILDDGVASTETFSIYYDNVIQTIDTFDWLNFHHFDYRGLIEKCLAIEAPEGMYNENC